MEHNGGNDGKAVPPAANILPPDKPPTGEAVLSNDPDYEVLKLIGRGGYGDVYLVRDRHNAFHAVKIVYRISFDSERPYEREYEGICKFEPISHLSANQLQIRHVGRRDEAGYFYYLMEAADDAATSRDFKPDEYTPRTLKSDQARQGGRIPAGECCHIARALAAALENLHEHRLVHRDIKPANIIFVDGLPKLADPGLVTDADRSVSCAGTEGYIPPEGPGSARADIYSLGMVLYEICTGCHRNDFPRLPEGFAELPDHKQLLKLNRIYTKACQSSRRRRYQSAREMKKALEALLEPQTTAGWRGPLWVGAGTLVIAGLAWSLMKSSHTQINESRPVRLTPELHLPSAGQHWTNSLGMRFVPVPGEKALFGAFETRVQDYEVFAIDTKVTSPKPSFQQGPAHPVVNVSWSDAKAFCEWLTAKEKESGKLSAGQSYRLPTDEEWSIAAGLSPEHGNSPAEKSGRIEDVYPWGGQWPPPTGAGNFAEDLKIDEFAQTSPVASFAPNRFGLFDMGGNVWQWCEESFDGDQRKHVARGSSFADNRKEDICLSHRFWATSKTAWSGAVSGVSWI